MMARGFLRRAHTTPTILRCACGHAERWPIPFKAEVGRCTCNKCGGQLREAPASVTADVAWRQTA